MAPLRFTSFIILLLVLIYHTTIAYALDVNKVRFGVHSDKTRIVIEINKQTEFRTFMLPELENKPYRLVVDMPDFNWQAGVIQRPPKTSVLDVRSGALDKNVKRIVVDLEKPVKIISAFTLPADKQNSERLVIDFTHISKSEFNTMQHLSLGTLRDTPNDIGDLIKSQTKDEDIVLQPSPDTKQSELVIPTRKPEKPKESLPAPAPVTKSPLRKALIVIDAGHGGQDPGAIGAERQREKDVTLSAAKLLKKKLERTGRYNVLLTRDNDKFIKLSRRVAIAREQDADLFISLHADSIDKSDVRGASIYTLSNKASDAQTARLAKRENQADLIAGVDLSHEDKDVANILLDLAMRDTMNQSKFFANTVVQEMRNHNIPVLPRTHRFAGFAVLKAPDVPSVLIEMGFMSNRSEARLLSSSDYQERIADSITQSIDAYFQKVERNNQ